MCLLSNDIYDYNVVSQGKTTIPNLDDGEEFCLTDVSSPFKGRRQKNEVLDFFIVLVNYAAWNRQ